MDVNGKPKSALAIYSTYLMYLRKEMSSFAMIIRDSKLTQWVLTLPATSSASLRAFIQKAMRKVIIDTRKQMEEVFTCPNKYQSLLQMHIFFTTFLQF